MVIHKAATSKSPWFYIIRHADLVYNVHTKVGDGTGTYFWEDHWKGDRAFKSLFPRLYNIAEIKHLSIRDVWDDTNGFWNRRLGRNLKDDEICDRIDLQQMLPDSHQSRSKDVWIWYFNSEGTFSVDSLLYQLSKLAISIDTNLYKLIWKFHCPKKIKFLLSLVPQHSR